MFLSFKKDRSKICVWRYGWTPPPPKKNEERKKKKERSSVAIHEVYRKNYNKCFKLKVNRKKSVKPDKSHFKLMIENNVFFRQKVLFATNVGKS